MAPSDFQKPRVDFYWKSEADTNRTVGVRVLTEDGICEDVENYTVRIGNTSNTQPEDFYVVSNDRMGNNSTRVLQEHNAWHNQYMFASRATMTRVTYSSNSISYILPIWMLFEMNLDIHQYRNGTREHLFSNWI